MSNGIPNENNLNQGFDFIQDGILFADGLRNEVGLAFDQHGYLWGTEAGHLGGDIHNNNPAEELHRFDPGMETPLHFGYPYCFTGYSLPESISPSGRGTIWTWPSFLNDGTHSDEWCRSNTRV